MSSTLHDFDARIARYATGSFDDSTPLPQAGIDSLALLRLAVESAAASDTEIDASQLVTLRTVGDVKFWLRDLAEAATDEDLP
ncbi:acyl carrier protein [Micromonospora sp. CA-259024]|uniref:acyl carrier protein n=1 Tax=Micromonospora sp. CA-259024 TaxID=3239965 RepID=UPI003D913A67